ncbi:hypothetical protein Glove_508g56 [Diversispora epigaea]|uniref:Uncharacterized protein n=1 Tax=Diversispora epigaea TaxID=1348612 RepID=A0A397GLM5_9GLOM|nr:hypothetical protein Glove_508g56 [Diversispora epigaea]
MESDQTPMEIVNDITLENFIESDQTPMEIVNDITLKNFIESDQTSVETVVNTGTKTDMMTDLKTYRDSVDERRVQYFSDDKKRKSERKTPYKKCICSNSDNNNTFDPYSLKILHSEKCLKRWSRKSRHQKLIFDAVEVSTIPDDLKIKYKAVNI